ncbi:SPOR domain-containing protein [Marinicella gelatinilytica]|uniref:SPOR domain-containing protein n=1 Tax=Marinicella gelatinilytica TaxID=2996017 RepID=UPI002260B128|nr:SPOR domain-containing protein [Marinicella gelatinilytica]MCX7545968.1 SPOR domain-containing protein [Marinicella gelatinilytica]
MDQELKQRLIGASVIIALAVIFIPMLFDGEVEKTGDKKIDIVIPESGRHELTVKTFSLDDEQQNPEVDKQSVPETELNLVDGAVVSRETVSGNGLIDPLPKTTDTNQTDSDKDARQDTKNSMAVVTDVSDDDIEQDDLDEATVDTTPAEKPKELSTAADNQSETTAVSTTDQQDKIIYRVKLGSFSKADNAQQVKNKLAQQGIGSLVEPAPDRALYRVWSDALYQDKNKANEYVTAVNKLKLNIGSPKVITVSEAEVKASADQGQLGWVVQLGSFAAKDNALDLRNKLKLAGFVAFVDQVNNSQGEIRYRLRVGPVNSRDQADQMKQQISEKLKLDGLVKTHELATLVD